MVCARVAAGVPNRKDKETMNELRNCALLLKILITVFLLLLPCLSLAQSTVALRSDPFNEKLREEALIAGAVIVGIIHHRPVPESQQAVSLSAFIPQSWADGNVCARLLSSDGLYEADIDYWVSEEWSGGLVEFPYPTAHLEVLMSLNPTQLGARLTKGECAMSSAVSSVVLWNDGPSTDPATLLVNSFRAEEVFAYVDDQPAVRCTPVTARGTAAFDHSCEIPDDASGLVVVEIYRTSNGKPAPPTTAHVWIGDTK